MRFARLVLVWSSSYLVDNVSETIVHSFPLVARWRHNCSRDEQFYFLNTTNVLGGQFSTTRTDHRRKCFRVCCSISKLMRYLLAEAHLSVENLWKIW